MSWIAESSVLQGLNGVCRRPVGLVCNVLHGAARHSDRTCSARSSSSARIRDQPLVLPAAVCTQVTDAPLKRPMARRVQIAVPRFFDVPNATTVKPFPTSEAQRTARRPCFSAIETQSIAVANCERKLLRDDR